MVAQVIKATVVVRLQLADGTERIQREEVTLRNGQDPVLVAEHTANLLAAGMLATDRMVCTKCGAPAVNALPPSPWEGNIRGAWCPTLGCHGGVWQAPPEVA